jgi:hypothetical protein
LGASFGAVPARYESVRFEMVRQSPAISHSAVERGTTGSGGRDVVTRQCLQGFSEVEVVTRVVTVRDKFVEERRIEGFR